MPTGWCAIMPLFCCGAPCRKSLMRVRTCFLSALLLLTVFGWAAENHVTAKRNYLHVVMLGVHCVSLSCIPRKSSSVLYLLSIAQAERFAMRVIT